MNKPFPFFIERARVGLHALPGVPINDGRFAAERGVAGALGVWATAPKMLEGLSKGLSNGLSNSR